MIYVRAKVRVRHSVCEGGLDSRVRFKHSFTAVRFRHITTPTGAKHLGKRESLSLSWFRVCLLIISERKLPGQLPIITAFYCIGDVKTLISRTII